MKSFRSINLRITQAHIDAARCRLRAGHSRRQNCPIALALKSRGAINPVVDSIAWRESGSDVANYLTPRAQSFVLEFDIGNTVEPCTLRIMIGGPA